jgi:ribosomal protein S18 acetylase RimI-like enzyme
MIRFATYNDIPALTHIRKVCFDEGVGYSNFYFAKRFTVNNTLVYEEEGRPVATLTLLDAEVLTAKSVLPIAYVYSVATLPDCRRRGLAAALLQYADEYLQKRGVAASLLAPASADLFTYYAKLGYETKFFITKHGVDNIDVKTNNLAQLADLTAADYFRLRRKAYAAGGYYVQWDSHALDFALSECRLVGGKAWLLRTDTAEGFLLAYPGVDDTVVVKESWLDGDLYSLALGLLQQTFGGQRRFRAGTRRARRRPRENFAVPGRGNKNRSIPAEKRGPARRAAVRRQRTPAGGPGDTGPGGAGRRVLHAHGRQGKRRPGGQRISRAAGNPRGGLSCGESGDREGEAQRQAAHRHGGRRH